MARGRNTIRRRSARPRLGALTPVLLFLACTTDYNPFTDAGNARIEIASCSFDDGAAVPIFTTQQLQVVVAARDMVDSFTVSATGNRLFADSTVRPPFASQPYPFAISLYDTGLQTVRLVTHRSGGEDLERRLSLTGVSPLRQAAVTGELGDTFTLETPAVGDADVIYQWNFGNGCIVTSAQPHAVTPLTTAGPGTAGMLTVSDTRRRHVSPTAAFSYELADNLGPLIDIPQTLMRGDTMVTADTNFILNAFIREQGRGFVAGAQVNGAPFDYDRPPYYTAILQRLDTLQSALAVTLTAWDNYLNTTTRRLYLRFDPAAGQFGFTAISVLIPRQDTSRTSRGSYTLIGTVIGSGTGTGFWLKLRINGAVAPGTLLVTPGQLTEWQWTVDLVNGPNDITIAAQTQEGATLADTAVVIVLESAGSDTTAPVFVDIQVDGSSEQPFFTPLHTCQVRVLAFDEHSDIPSLSIAGTLVSAREPYRWYAEVPLTHASFPQGNRIEIRAVDMAGNRRDTTILIYQNAAPVITAKPQPPVPLHAGVRWTDSLRLADADGDAVTVTPVSVPAGMTVSSAGTLSWQPSETDAATDPHVVILGYTDGYAFGLDTTEVWVVSQSVTRTPVTFAITESAFPQALEAGADSCAVVLTVSEGTGYEPFRYTVLWRESSSLTTHADGVLRWAPAAADTGTHSLVVTVTDKIGLTDKLYPVITVVPPNRPCSLAVSHNADTTPDGDIDLRTAAAPETLFFSIIDPDPAIVERHSVSVSYTHAQTIEQSDTGGMFTVILDPQQPPQVEHDTITVTVTDAGGNAFTLTLPVTYPPVWSPALPSPADGAGGLDTALALSWAASARPSDRFDLYLDETDGSTLLAAGLSAAGFAATGLSYTTTYRWQVCLAGQRPDGPVWSFATRSNAVRKKVVINTVTAGVAAGADLAGFPVLVRLATPAFDFTAAGASAAGLRFEKPDGTPLPFDVERWDSATGIAEIWVRADTVYGGDAAQWFSLTYDRSQTAGAANPAAVFTAADGFRGVWHLDENPAAGGHAFRDRSPLGNHGVPYGSMTQAALVEGAVGRALDFDGYNDYIKIDSPATSLQFTTHMTLSAWCRPGSFDPGSVWHNVIARQFGIEWDDSYVLGFRSGSPAILLDWKAGYVAGSSVSTAAWYQVTGVRDGNAGLYLYVNGVRVAEASPYSAPTPSDPNEVTIGAQQNASGQFGEPTMSEFFDGVIDEVRASSVARGPAWIRMCYENQKPGSAVVTVQDF